MSLHNLLIERVLLSGWLNDEKNRLGKGKYTYEICKNEENDGIIEDRKELI